MYLEEIMKKFRAGVKIRRQSWAEERYVFIDKDKYFISDQGHCKYNFHPDDFQYGDWEIYDENKYDWSQIISKKMPCWFWNEDPNRKDIGFLISYCDFFFTKENLSNNSLVEYKHCRPVYGEELTFYAQKRLIKSVLMENN